MRAIGTSVWERLGNLPPKQLILVVSAIFVFLIGNHFVFRTYRRRVHEKTKLIMNPFPAFLRFRLREWAGLILVAGITWVLLLLALHA